MPFEKGNKLGSKSKGRVGIRKKMYRDVSEKLIALSPEYNELLGKLFEGEELMPPQKDGMDRFEKMYEFAKPKKARTEHVGEGGGAVEVDTSITIKFEK